MKNNIYCKNNRLNLININEDDFLEKIDNIYDERKIIEIDLQKLKYVINFNNIFSINKKYLFYIKCIIE